MTYSAYNPSQPAFRDNREVTIDAIRNNEIALRNALLIGMTPGWFHSIAGSHQPFVINETNNGEQHTTGITWGTMGGATGQPTQVDYLYKPDAGILTPTETIGIETATYDANGNLETTTWS